MHWEKNYGIEFRDELVDEVLMADEGWAAEKVARVAIRLQARISGERFEVLVPCLSAHTAFTTFGKYIYISRRLLERCTSDDMLAMIIAHEIAHHELGHLTLRWPALPRLSATIMALGSFRAKPEQEFDADSRAIELCIDAGYAPAKCLELFRLLEQISLDYGDTEGVWGTGASQRASTQRQHPPIREREEAVRIHARELLQHRSTGEGVFRYADVRQLCSFCSDDRVSACEHCSTPLCEDHQIVHMAPCIRCGANPLSVCSTCHDAEQCFSCGSMRHCRYCDELAEASCKSCGWVFCAEHDSLASSICASCRFHRQHAAETRVERGNIALAVVLVALVVALLAALPLQG